MDLNDNPFYDGGDTGGDVGTMTATPGGESSTTSEGAGSDAGQPSQQPQAQPAAPAQSPLTLEQIAQAVRDGTIQAHRSTQPQQTRQPEQVRLTQDEERQMFHRYDLNAETASQLGMAPEAVPVFNQILRGIVQEAEARAQYQVFMHQKQLEQFWSNWQQSEWAPVATERQQQTLNSQEEKFFQNNADLKDFKPILLAVRDRLASQGRRFVKPDGRTPDWDGAHKAVADEARAIISKLPGFQNNGVANGAQPGSNGNLNRPQTPRRMTPVSTGGAGGIGGGGPATAESAVKAIFG